MSHTEQHTLSAAELWGLLGTLPPSALAVVDIDSTLMDTAPRNRRIMQSAARRFPELETVVDQLTREDLGWGAAASAAERAGMNRERSAELYAYWRERFFSNAWLAYDRPYPGAASLMLELRARDIGIVYLSGRDTPNMKAGTLESLHAHGFPTGRGTRLLLKPTPDMPDLGFKQNACSEIAALGTVVLALENEPGNANALKAAFPTALVYLIRTITSPNPEPLRDDIRQFDHYAS